MTPFNIHFVFQPVLVLLVPAIAHAHIAHIGELAGHSHWIGVGALVGAATLAAALARCRKPKRQEEAEETEEQAEGEAEPA